MTFDRLALDTSAAVELFSKTPPAAVRNAGNLILPLPVVGELRFGALNAAAQWREEALRKLDELLAVCTTVAADLRTVPHYAEVRAQVAFPPNMSRRRETNLLNDLWIAAICLAENLPLLTNDKDFERIERLTVVPW